MDWREEGRRKLECPNLIDELTFSRAYSWFWRAAIPMSEAYVRRINLGLYERAVSAIAGKLCRPENAPLSMSWASVPFGTEQGVPGGVLSGCGQAELALATEIEEVWGRIGRLKDQTDRADRSQTDTR